MCPLGTLPDHGACVPVPLTPRSEAEAQGPSPERERAGRYQEYDYIPKLPERPADYSAYRLPVAPLATPSSLAACQAAGRPSAIDIAQKRGAEVRLARLEQQEGDAEVLFVGPLLGNTVVVRQAVREGGALREYLALYGHLERVAPGLARGSSLSDGALVGFAGDSGSPGVVQLHYEVRRVRPGFEARALEPDDFSKSSRTVACDPRNVLELLPR